MTSLRGKPTISHSAVYTIEEITIIKVNRKIVQNDTVVKGNIVPYAYSTKLTL